MSIPFKKYGYTINPITMDPEQPQIFLVDKNLRKKGELWPLRDLTFHIGGQNEMDEVSFIYDKEINGKKRPLFDELEDLAVIQVKDYGFFEIQISKTNSTSSHKSVWGRSLGYAELSQILATLEINTEDDIARIDYDKDYPTVFYRDIELTDSEDIKKKKKESSLLDRILSYAPHYKVGHVDPTLKHIQRTFSWENTDIVSILDAIAEEVSCMFVIDVTIEDGVPLRTVSAYDIQYCSKCYEDLSEEGKKTSSTHKFRNIVNGVCQNCGSSKFIKDIGQDTNIFISTDHLSDEIIIKGNADNIKNCFKVVGGDDTITSTVQGLNLSASDRIMMFSDAQKKKMSKTLAEKLSQYEESYQENQPAYEKLLEIMYDLYDVIPYLESGKMPILEEDITSTDMALYHTLEQITEYYKNYFYIDKYSNYTNHSYTTVKTSINNMITTFIPKGYSFLVDTDNFTDTDSDYQPGISYQWYGKIKFYSTGNREDFYTIHITKDNGTYITHGDSTEPFTFSDASKQALIKAFQVRFRFADKDQQDYMNYIEQHTAYILSTVDLTYDNEKTRDWSQYSYNRLNSFYDGFTKCLDTIDSLLLENKEDNSASDILTNIRTSYMSIREDISRQMDVLQDQMFALRSYLGDYEDSPDFVDEDGKVQYELPPGTSIRDVFEAMLDASKTGGYTENGTYVVNYYIGNKPVKCKKCGSTNVAVNANGVVCNNCDSTGDDIYTYRDIMGDIASSQIEHPTDNIMDMRASMRKQMDMKDFISDDSLYQELCSFIREDVYSNQNYTSDGLTNAQILEQARELLTKAEQELSKACTPQYTITTALSAVVAQKEFMYQGVLVNDDYSGFRINNWVRVKIDDEIYKMRIKDMRFSFPISDKIEVNFSNVTKKGGPLRDIRDAFVNAKNMATSYNYVATQAEQGEIANTQLHSFLKEGIDAGLMAVKAGQNQDVVIDNHGILLRKMVPETGEYSGEQIKFINRNIVLTDDNWEHARMAIGLGTYNGKSVYGVWADVLVGKLIAGENLIISNQDEKGNSSVVIDKDGIDITNGSIFIENQNGCSVMIDPMYSLKENMEHNVFAIKNQRKELVMGVDADGTGTFDGKVNARKGGKIAGFDIEDYRIWSERAIDNPKFNTLLSIDSIANSITLDYISEQFGEYHTWIGETGIRISDSNVSEARSQYVDLTKDHIFISDWTTNPANGTFIFPGYIQTTSGNITNSDKASKHNIVDIPEAEQFILNLKPKMFQYNSGTSGRNHFGFIAQDVEKNMLSTTGDAGIFVKYKNHNTEAENTDAYGLRYEEFIAPIVATIQSLNEKIEKQNTEIQSLKKIIEVLEGKREEEQDD